MHIYTDNCHGVTRVARLSEKAPTRLLLTAVGALIFGVGAVILFGLLSETLKTTLGDLRRLLTGIIFRPNVA